MQELLLSIYINIILMIALLWSMFSSKISKYIKKIKRKRLAARASSRNLEKANLTRIIRTEVRKYLEELKND